MSTFSTVITYDVFNSKEHLVKIKVNFGYNQLASTLVKLNLDDHGQFEGNFEMNLGSNESLAGKYLALYTNISDINPSSDNLSMEIIIEGGKKAYKEFALDRKIPSNDNIAGIVTIYFI